MKKTVYDSNSQDIEDRRSMIKRSQKALKDQLKALDAEQVIADTEFANVTAPYKVGNRILVSEKRYPRFGAPKKVIIELEVAFIVVEREKDEYIFSYRCFKIKANGEASCVIHRGAAIPSSQICGLKRSITDAA